MLSPWFLPGMIAVALLAVCGIAYLAAAGLRTLSIPACWRCGATKVRPSAARPGLDAVVQAFLLRPYRCAGCRTRFYGFRTLAAAPSVPALPEPAPAAPFEFLPERRQRIRLRVVVRLNTGSESPLTIFAFVWFHSQVTSWMRLFSARQLSADPGPH